MCGIAGIAGRHDPAGIERMLAVQAHRGPDDCGTFHDPHAGVTLGMRRLSIVDQAGGHQPMSDPGQTLWVVYNGELYNAPALRAELERRGRRFSSTHSDTENLLHLYAERGEAMLPALEGMFAFVLFDTRRQVLFGARDRIGIKPFYYVEQPGMFAFASELKALLTLPCVERELDPESLFHYMSLLYVPGERSIIKGVRRLPPGHWLRYDLASRRLSTGAYWDLDLRRTEERSVEEWQAILRRELRDSVERHTMSDVPLGCSLSGGIDSASIVGLLAHDLGQRVKTYSLGFAGEGEEAWDELPLARAVARRWGTEHHEMVLEPAELLRDLVQMVWALDEPYGGGLPSWYVFQFMRQDVTVGLTGTGGDELFGNYGKFRAFEQSPLARLAMRQRGRSSWAGEWLRRCTGPLVGTDPLRRYYTDLWYYFSDPMKREIVFQRDTAPIPDTARLLQELYDRSGAPDVRGGLAYVDFKTQLPEEFLLGTDRLSMAHSLEARVPFLDARVVETVFRIPAGVRTKAQDVKYLLKGAVADLLAPELLRARKRGFVIPIELWLRQQLRPLAEQLLSPERLERQGFFKPLFYHRYVAPHLSGRENHTWQVWAALMFQLWHVIFIEEAAVEAPTYSWDTVGAQPLAAVAQV